LRALAAGVILVKKERTTVRRSTMHPADYARIEKAIHYLEGNFRRQPNLKEVAGKAGLSEYHFHRLFTRWAGISPKRFLQFLTATYARGLLRESPDILNAAYDAGLSGPGRLHDLIVNVYAVTPGELKKEGEGVTIRYGVHPSPFGDLMLAITGKGICVLSFLSGRHAGEAGAELRKQWGRAKHVEDPKATKAVVDRIFGPSRQDGAPPLSVIVKGTNFQVKVWEALVRIPPGCAASYEGIAARIGSPGAARAVGKALARNPVGFLIPCHRVIRKTGAFGDYRWGPARKKAILAWEAARFRAQEEEAIP
jgi:AraC family transcriptional regulator of adaptative response/methylated-DNA-[protein]-cysteine methyltransferase